MRKTIASQKRQPSSVSWITPAFFATRVARGTQENRGYLSNRENMLRYCAGHPEKEVWRIMKTKAVGSVQKLGQRTIDYLLLSNRNGKDRRMPPAVFLLFVLSVVIHGLILPGPHALTTSYDEMLYWGLAKMFWIKPFTLYHVPVLFSKFIYSLVLSPLFLIKNPILRSEVAIWLNTVMMSFSVFPAYRLVKKLSASPKVQLVSLALFMCSPIMNYSEKYVPECLYLPLSLYLILGYYSLYQHINDSGSWSLRKLSVRAALLGLFAYVTYMEREAASAFFGAFLIWTLIAAVRGCRQKTNSWTRHLTVVLAHGGAVAISHLLMKLLLGVQFSYTHQMVLGNVDSMYKIEYLIHCVINNGLYICVALFGIPVLYWQMKRNRGGRLAEEGAAYRDWIIFLSIAFALTLFFISYGISAKEDLGKTNIRLHTRYYIPFLPSLFALVLEEIRKSPGRAARAGIAGVLIIGVSCVLLLNPNRYVAAYDSNDTWHIQDLNGVFDDLSQEKEATKEEGGEETAAWVKPLKAFFADQTAGSKEITYNHGLLLSMSAYTLLTVLIVLLTRRRKKAAFALFCCLVLAVEGYNNVMSVQRYKKVCVDYAEAEAFVELGESITELVGDENLLIVNASNTQGRKRKTETFFNFDWYSMLNKGLNKVLGPDGVIDLNTTELPVSMSQFLASKNYPMGTTFAYVMCSKDVRFNESCVEEVLYSKETGYHLYRLVDPAFLDVDYIKDYYEE